MAIYNRVCQTCGITFKGGPRAWYCPECRKEREKERAAKYRKAPAKRPIGSTDICNNCGENYIVAAGIQKYCNKCKNEMYKKLDREQGLDYYKKNKDTINPKRNAQRRHIGKRCPICGKDFYSPTVTPYCSEECRREAKKSNARLIYDKRRKK